MGRERIKVLTIAGFDPSGGAGVLADCKVFENQKMLGMAVVTANTVQTEDTFFAANWISAEVIEQQLQVLLYRYSFDWVKIGLIENATILEKIIHLLKAANPKTKIIWDPVLAASSGGDFDLTRFNSWDSFLSVLYAITPNTLEYAALFNQLDAKTLAKRYQLAIYLKGGHAIKKGVDYLYTPLGQCHTLNPKAICELDKHGTGCIFSAAWLSYLALDFPVLKAAFRAKKYVSTCLSSNESKLAYHR